MKAKNPQMFQMIEQARQNNADPMEMFKEVTKGYSKEQMDSLINQAKNMGFPRDVLDKVQDKMS